MWFYKDVDQSPIIGCQFEIVPTDYGSTPMSIRSSVVTNSGSEIEFSNESLKESIVNIYSKKLLGEKKVFFHWKVIEEFEKDVEQKPRRPKQKRKKL